MLTPADMISNTKLKENANIVLLKIDDGIYMVEKDRHERIMEVYISTEKVIQILNENLKVAIYGKDQLGVPKLIHYNP
jgi:hypothetical protein